MSRGQASSPAGWRRLLLLQPAEKGVRRRSRARRVPLSPWERGGCREAAGERPRRAAPQDAGRGGVSRRAGPHPPPADAGSSFSRGRRILQSALRGGSSPLSTALSVRSLKLSFGLHRLYYQAPRRCRCRSICVHLCSSVVPPVFAVALPSAPALSPSQGSSALICMNQRLPLQWLLPLRSVFICVHLWLRLPLPFFAPLRLCENAVAVAVPSASICVHLRFPLFLPLPFHLRLP